MGSTCYNASMKTVAFEKLRGLTLKKIDGLKKNGDCVIFHSTVGPIFIMQHHQDCCEDVRIKDVAGDVEDLIDNEILMAQEVSNHEGDQDNSQTWTFYTLRTNAGTVTIRWLGISNGYYSESVEFEAVECLGEAKRLGFHP